MIRIKGILNVVLGAANSRKPCMILIDEPYRGTSPEESLLGAASFIDSMLCENVYKNSLMVLATHHRQLGQSHKVSDGKVSNMQVESFVGKIDDKIHYTYKWKPGVSGNDQRIAVQLMKESGMLDLAGDKKVFDHFSKQFETDVPRAGVAATA